MFGVNGNATPLRNVMGSTQKDCLHAPMAVTKATALLSAWAFVQQLTFIPLVSSICDDHSTISNMSLIIYIT